MRILAALIAMALILGQGVPAAAQNAGSLRTLPGNNVRNPAGTPRQSVAPKADAPHAAAGAAADANQTRYRYKQGHWWYWGPNAAQVPSLKKDHEPFDYDSHAFGQPNNNRFGAPAFSRYSTGYGANWNPYRGFDYGYQSGFGANYYGYGNSYRGYGNGFYGYGYGVFSNGAFNTGD